MKSLYPGWPSFNSIVFLANKEPLYFNLLNELSLLYQKQTENIDYLATIHLMVRYIK